MSNHLTQKLSTRDSFISAAKPFTKQDFMRFLEEMERREKYIRQKFEDARFTKEDYNMVINGRAPSE